MAIAFGVVGVLASVGRADEPLTPVNLNSGTGYIVPEKYANEHKADFLGSLVSYTKTVDFWTPTPGDVAVAERTLREMIHRGASDPGEVFPSMIRPENTFGNSSGAPSGNDIEIENEKNELIQVDANYEKYARQFVGIILDEKKFVLCNFVVAYGANPAKDYLFLQKVFEPQDVHFLQARFDPETRKCTNVSLIGWWQEPPEEK
jgi:hypothetical protein